MKNTVLTQKPQIIDFLTNTALFSDFLKYFEFLSKIWSKILKFRLMHQERVREAVPLEEIKFIKILVEISMETMELATIFLGEHFSKIFKRIY